MFWFLRQLADWHSTSSNTSADDQQQDWLGKVRKQPWLLKNAPDEIRNDKRIVMVAVQSDGWALEYASPSLQADPEVVKAAVKCTGLALQFAAPEVRNNMNFVDEHLKEDRDVLIAAGQMTIDGCEDDDEEEESWERMGATPSIDVENPPFFSTRPFWNDMGVSVASPSSFASPNVGNHPFLPQHLGNRMASTVVASPAAFPTPQYRATGVAVLAPPRGYTPSLGTIKAGAAQLHSSPALPPTPFHVGGVTAPTAPPALPPPPPQYRTAKLPQQLKDPPADCWQTSNSPKLKDPPADRPPTICSTRLFHAADPPADCSSPPVAVTIPSSWTKNELDWEKVALPPPPALPPPRTTKSNEVSTANQQQGYHQQKVSNMATKPPMKGTERPATVTTATFERSNKPQTNTNVNTSCKQSPQTGTTTPVNTCTDDQIWFSRLQSNGMALRDAPNRIRDDKNAVLLAVAQEGFALQYASPQNRNDRQVVNAAIQQNVDSFQYASKDLLKDKDFVRQHIILNPEHIKYVHENLKRDISFVLEHIKLSPRHVKYVHEDIKRQREIMIAAGMFDEEYHPFSVDYDIKIVLSTRFALKETSQSEATTFTKLLRNHPYIRRGKFKIYAPNAFDKETCDRKWTNFNHPCRGTKETCEHKNVLTGAGRPTDDCCWRFSYRFHLEEAKASRGFMLQLVETGESFGVVHNAKLGNGQRIEQDMAQELGMKTFHVYRPVDEDGYEAAFKDCHIRDVVAAIKSWYDNDRSDMSEYKIRPYSFGE